MLRRAPRLLQGRGRRQRGDQAIQPKGKKGKKESIGVRRSKFSKAGVKKRTKDKKMKSSQGGKEALIGCRVLESGLGMQ